MELHSKWLKLNDLSDKLRLQQALNNAPLSYEESQRAISKVKNEFNSAGSKLEMYSAINKASFLILRVENDEQLFNLRISIREMFREVESK